MGRLSRILSESYVLVKMFPRSKSLLFWIIGFPLIFYGLTVAIWGSPTPPTINVGVYSADNPAACNATVNMTKVLVDAMKESGLFKVHMYKSEGEVTGRVKHARLDAGLIVPENFTCAMLKGSAPEIVVVAVRSSWANYSATVLESFVSSFGDNVRRMIVENSTKYIMNYTNKTIAQQAVRWLRFIAEPVRVKANVTVPPLLATAGGVRAFYALGMIGVEALFIGLSVGVSSIVERKSEGSLRMILASPMSGADLLAADTLSALLGFGISGVTIFLVSLAMGARYDLSPGILAVTVALLLLGALSMIGLGLLLAPLARSSEAVTVIVNSIAFPAMFIGGIMIPKDFLPGWAASFAEVFPHSRLLEASRLVLIYGYTPAQAIRYAVPAIIATIVIYVVGALVVMRLLEKSQEY